MAPAMEACCLSESFLIPFPAQKAAPPWETWRMMGDLRSRAASRAALAVEDEVTFCRRGEAAVQWKRVSFGSLMKAEELSLTMAWRV